MVPKLSMRPYVTKIYSTHIHRHILVIIGTVEYKRLTMCPMSAQCCSAWPKPTLKSNTQKHNGLVNKDLQIFSNSVSHEGLVSKP